MKDHYFKILIRVDASAEIGIGHFMRCLALAQVFRDKGCKVIFLCAQVPSKLTQLLQKEKFGFIQFNDIDIGCNEDAANTARFASLYGADWVIADGYAFSDSFQSTIKQQKLQLALFDDYGHAEHYCADVIINPGFHPNIDLYCQREKFTLLLLGPMYIPLRQEFLRLSNYRNEIAFIGQKVLVSMGGSDRNEMSLMIVEALTNLDQELQIVVVLGPSAFIPIKSFADYSQVVVIKNPDNMAEIMKWADIGISAGGTTLAEMAHMGLPHMIIKTAANQQASRFYSETFGASVFLGDWNDITRTQIMKSFLQLSYDYRKRQQMSKNGVSLVDGQGGQRIYNKLLSFKS